MIIIEENRKVLGIMKKRGLILGSLGVAFGYAVWKKSQKPKWNKRMVKGKTKELVGDLTNNQELRSEGKFDQVVGTSQEVAHDIANRTTQFVEEAVDQTKTYLDKNKQ